MIKENDEIGYNVYITDNYLAYVGYVVNEDDVEHLLVPKIVYNVNKTIIGDKISYSIYSFNEELSGFRIVGYHPLLDECRFEEDFISIENALESCYQENKIKEVIEEIKNKFINTVNVFAECTYIDDANVYFESDGDKDNVIAANYEDLNVVLDQLKGDIGYSANDESDSSIIYIPVNILLIMMMII